MFITYLCTVDLDSSCFFFIQLSVDVVKMHGGYLADQNNLGSSHSFMCIIGLQLILMCHQLLYVPMHAGLQSGRGRPGNI